MSDDFETVRAWVNPRSHPAALAAREALDRIEARLSATEKERDRLRDTLQEAMRNLAKESEIARAWQEGKAAVVAERDRLQEALEHIASRPSQATPEPRAETIARQALGGSSDE